MYNLGKEHISDVAIVKYFIVAALLCLASDIPESFPISYLIAKTLVYAVLFFHLLLPNRRALIFLLMISVTGQDIIQASTDWNSDSFLMASIWQGSLGPLRPSWVVMLFCLILIFRSRIFLVDRTVLYAAIWFATVPLLTAWLYGSFHTQVAAIEIPNDIKMPLFLIVSTLLFGSYLKSHPASLVEFGTAFLGTVLARHMVDFCYAMLGFGAQFGDVLRVSVDSTKGTVVFLLLFSFFLILRNRHALIGKSLSIMSAILLIVYATRGLWVSATIGILVFSRMMKAEKLLLFLPILSALGYGILITLSMLFPETIDLATKRLDEHALYYTDNMIEQYFPTRYAEILNATDATIDRWAVLWGSGYGSYYTETVQPFPDHIESAFSEHSLTSGRFYTIHHFVFRSLFEYGIIGFSLLASLWIIPGWRCFKILWNPPSTLLSGVLVAMVAFLPTSMLEMTWTSKGMIISGFIIACFQCISAQNLNRAEVSKKAQLRSQVAI